MTELALDHTGLAADRALEEELARVLGHAVELRARRRLCYRSSFAIDELELLVDGRRQRLLLKLLDEAALSDEGKRARPEFLRDAAHEVEIYREVLPFLGRDVPALHASAARSDGQRCWLLLERVDGVPLWQHGGIETWEATARWLARMHATPVPRSPALRVYNDAWHRHWLHRAVANAPAGTLDRIAAGHDRVCRALRAWPRTLIHGEFYPSNVLVEDAAGTIGLRVVDWEMAGTGPGLLDLAALTAGWTGTARGRLVRAYLEAWSGGGPVSLAELEHALEHARLQAALQWIGWSTRWTPPAPHARDWLAEALDAADRLSL